LIAIKESIEELPSVQFATDTNVGTKLSTNLAELGTDCISRQQAIDAINKIHPVDTEYDCTLYDKLDVMYMLKNLPSVTPQPKIESEDKE